MRSHQQTKASHAMALDFTYECLGQDEYRFYLNFYQDCSGTINVTIPIYWPTIYLSSQICNEFIELPLTYNAKPVSTQIIYDTLGNVIDEKPNFEVSALCDDVESTCDRGPYQGVEKFVFTADYTLPKKCSDWKISYSSCCRNEVITNLVAPGLADIYVEALINNTNGICNNSPSFTSLPVPYLCVGQKSFYNHGVFDVDGNDLKFTLINPLTKGGAPVEFTPNGGFTPTNPIRTINNNFQFDEQNGQMEFTPHFIEVDVVTVLVEEFNVDGLLIGSVMRDIQVVIDECDNQQSQLVDIENIEETAAIRVDNQTFEVCPGARINFIVNATDPDLDDTLQLKTNLATAIPNATFVTNGINPVSGNFNWQPTKTDVGLNSFTISLFDNVCPIPSNQIFGFNIFVVEGVNAGKDQVKCSDEPVILNAEGGTQFSWTSNTEMFVEYQSPKGDTLIVNPTQTTTYYVESNLGEQCVLFDTVVVKVQDGFDYTLNRTINVCQFDEVPLLIEPDPVSGPFTYQWEPANAFTQNNIPNPTVTVSSSMAYSVSVSNNNGCSISDQVQVNVAERVPDVQMVASKDTVCVGEVVDLTVELQPCTDCEVGEGNAETVDSSPFNLIWEDTKMQLLFLAEEIKAAQVPIGAINELSLTVTQKNSEVDLGKFQIAMGLTTANSLNTVLGFLDATENVFGPATVTTQMGINSFDLTVPFIWDGLSNIVVEMCYDNAEDVWSAPDRVLATNTNFVSVLKGDTDGATNCNLPGDEALNVRPDIRFDAAFTNDPDDPNDPNGLDDFEINWPNVSANSLSVSITPTNTSYYTVEVGSNNCLRKDSIQIFTYPKPSVSLGEDVQVFAGEIVQLEALGDFTDFEWLTTEGLSDTTIVNPVYTNEQSTQLIIQVNNNFNCIDVDTMQIRFEGCRAIEIPTAFSPNSDGINDVLQAIQVDDETVFEELVIFNRYGSRVFKTNNVAAFWDGSFQNQKQPIGVFSYRVSYFCNNKLESKGGTITLIR